MARNRSSVWCTCIYLTRAAVFVAQATSALLGIGGQLVNLGVLILTSKGSAGVAGAGFVTLGTTLSSFHAIPLQITAAAPQALH
ncbi:cation:dicarboxylate symporter family transporter [Pseudaminobacter soli (ex Zhang et al. 2022)]|uniref:cation:dicarboxylate symporter family transporter n=1 Tax=Pseudaminobacter soli (ex Zhang et al. 2022) TaxID=2831468 RepID=UPI001F022E57|nr:cation:dicarboxylase symporter family transporter [Pseudaminobacter soli]